MYRYVGIILNELIGVMSRKAYMKILKHYEWIAMAWILLELSELVAWLPSELNQKTGSFLC